MSRIEKDCALGPVSNLNNPPAEVRMGFDLEVRRPKSQSDNKPQDQRLKAVFDGEK